MTEQITMTFSDEDKKIFEEKTGMKFVEAIKLMMDNVKYGGKLGFDPFFSEENQTVLQKSIGEFKKGKVVEFSEADWEKFVNAQEI